MTLIPPRLQIGDTIGVVTPSGPISSSPSPDPQRELEKGIAYLKDLGFEALLGEHALKEGCLAAGTSTERAEDLFLEVTSDYELPILKTDDFGHHCPNTVLLVGVRAMLDADTSTLEIIEACVK